MIISPRAYPFAVADLSTFWLGRFGRRVYAYPTQWRALLHVILGRAGEVIFVAFPIIAAVVRFTSKAGGAAATENGKVIWGGLALFLIMANTFLLPGLSALNGGKRLSPAPSADLAVGSTVEESIIVYRIGWRASVSAWIVFAAALIAIALTY